MIWAGLNHLVVKYVLEKQMASERKVDYKKKIIIAIVRLVSLNLLGSFFFMSDQGEEGGRNCLSCHSSSLITITLPHHPAFVIH